ncbi:VOC family protein [Streptomyces sp. XM83C]|jgi:predicted enzyme related to lactoylglutathione lyase|uniref:VOC family protein n=1 Tax=Streptomyces thermocoprophilus TaxID=78356 RepID=A0ABV5V8F2_9ACTN|nr:VOC family protein [Streptomyces sp. XM83C]MCK1820588.1 VOC family protein [Streptomyces sp. XM83C]
MTTNDLVPGSPCWIDLGTPDIPAAAAFYRAVLGWEYEPMDTGGEAEGGTFRKDGRTVAGLGELTEKGARSAWMIYWTVMDADATARAVEAGGGTVRVAPRDLGEWGRMAQFTDPLGGQFAAWQPGQQPGLGLSDAPGSLNWTELYTSDTAAAKEFYGSVFGWQYSDMEMPGGEGTYTMITPAGRPAERMQGGLLELRPEDLSLAGGKPYWHPVFAVADCDAAVAEATRHGGRVQMGPADVEGVGRLAVCIDPYDADFVVLRPAER